MSHTSRNIHIIGAGISGLVAALVLEEHGYTPTILEASNSIGGRIQTDIIDGYQLDRGFQVLLTAYPAAQKYLDYNALELQPLLSGAAIFKNENFKIYGDGLRDISLLLPTLLSGIGTFSDQFKLLRLHTYLQRKSLREIFETKEQTTLTYLKNYGFSDALIKDFFKPFFSGIFLETDLETSSRMFEFVYKMFGEGQTAIPKDGMGAIPKQLFERLKNTKIVFNSPVRVVTNSQITLEDDSILQTDFTVITANPEHLINNLKNQEVRWKASDTFYFQVPKKILRKPLIGLVPHKQSLINNLFYPTSIKTTHRNSPHLLSVTVVDNQSLTNSDLINAVTNELQTLCGITVGRCIQHYHIPKSLPKLANLQYEQAPSETRLTESIFLAGDIQLNSSLNAAILAGEKAALGVIESIENTIV